MRTTKIKVSFKDYEGNEEVEHDTTQGFFNSLIQRQMKGEKLTYNNMPAKYIEWEFDIYPDSYTISWSEVNKEIVWTHRYYNNEPEMKIYQWSENNGA